MKPAVSSSRSRRSSVVDVARKAQVSLGTVSRVINRHANVDPELRRKVLIASREVGFVPKLPRHSIGVVVDDLTSLSGHGFGAAMLVLLMKQLLMREYTMELIDLDHLDLAYEANVEGLITLVFHERVATLRQIPNLPILTINEPETERGLHSVCSDHRQQAVLAMEHLTARGHRRIGFLERGPTNWGSQQRLDGYRASLKAADLTFDPDLVAYTVDIPLYTILQRLQKQGITALVNFSEGTTLETIRILTQIFKLTIPDEVSVIAMEDLPVFEHLTPPQTVVRQPTEELARVAVEQMLKLAHAPKTANGKGVKPVNIVLPCELVARDSVARVDSKFQVGGPEVEG